MQSKSSDALAYAGLGIVGVATWWAWAYQIDLVYAMKGFSPVGWVYKSLNPSDFALDFPGGMENYSYSLFAYAFRFANSLGISPEALLPAVIAFEIALFSGAMWALCRTLLPEAPRIVAFLVVALALATPVRDMNLGFFPEPYFSGQYYNVANALRIFGIVMVLRGRPLTAALLLAFSFATHATMGLTALLCAASMMLVRPRELFNGRYLAGGVVFALISGGWLLLQYRSATISAGQIPDQSWLEMTRAFSYHWYPVDNGLFGSRGQFVLLPFVTFLLLLAYYWPRSEGVDVVARRAGVGLLAMLGLSLLGLAISVLLPVPLLIKLALQRSNDLVIVIGLVYVVAGLWRDLQSAQVWRWAVAAAVLASLFREKMVVGAVYTVPEFPLLWSMALPIVLASDSWLRVLRRQPICSRDWAVAGLAATVVGLGLMYVSVSAAAGVNPLFISGGRRAWLLLGVFLLLAAAFARWVGRRYMLGYVVVAVVSLALFGLWEFGSSKLDAPMARGYLEAQLWARDNTPRSALFMPDPTFYYGWRDYSRRSSFGNVREWLHMGWIYDSSFETYAEGLRRFEEFDVDLEPALHAEPPIAAVQLLTRAVKEHYYEVSDEWRLRLADRYGIDYFVLSRREMNRSSQMPVAFENEHFVILASPE